MRAHALLGILLAFLCLSLSAGAETLYKSIGPDGRIVYSDRPPVDQRTVKTLSVMTLPASRVPTSPGSPSQAANPGLLGGDGVMLFSADWCGYCRKAKSYLADKHIAYREFDIDTPDGRAAYSQAGGGGSVPLLLFQGRKVQGFDKAGYDAFFAQR